MAAADAQPSGSTDAARARDAHPPARALAPGESGFGFEFAITDEDVRVLRVKGDLAAQPDEFADRLSSAFTPERASLVVILGWNFSRPAHLRRVAELYREAGITDWLMFCPTLGDTYGTDAACRIAHLVTRAIAAHGARFVLVHAFSGSCYIYVRMLVWAAVFYPDAQARIAGAVFDSTPIDATPANGAAAVLETTGWSALASALARPALVATLWLYWSVVMPWDSWVAKWKGRFWASVFPCPPVRVPTLFFASAHDPIAPLAFIRSQADALAARSHVDVRLVDLAAVPAETARSLPAHCTGLLSHPQLYRAEIVALMARARRAQARAPTTSKL